MLADYHESGQSCLENLKKKKTLKKTKKTKNHTKLNMAHLQFDVLQIYAT